MSPKIRKYKVWVHVDTGYSVEIAASSPEEAEEEARHNSPLSYEEYTEQLRYNAQIGEANVTEVK